MAVYSICHMEKVKKLFCEKYDFFVYSVLKFCLKMCIYNYFEQIIYKNVSGWYYNFHKCFLGETS